MLRIGVSCIAHALPTNAIVDVTVAVSFPVADPTVLTSSHDRKHVVVVVLVVKEGGGLASRAASLVYVVQLSVVGCEDAVHLQERSLALALRLDDRAAWTADEPGVPTVDASADLSVVTAVHVVVIGNVLGLVRRHSILRYSFGHVDGDSSLEAISDHSGHRSHGGHRDCRSGSGRHPRVLVIRAVVDAIVTVVVQVKHADVNVSVSDVVRVFCKVGSGKV